jgi:hypothetical protein
MPYRFLTIVTGRNLPKIRQRASPRHGQSPQTNPEGWAGGRDWIARALALVRERAESQAMTDKLLLAVCAVLVGFGIVIIAMSVGFFMNLLGAGINGVRRGSCLSHSIPSSTRHE